MRDKCLLYSLFIVFCSDVCPQNISVLTHRYNNRRLGLNDSEKLLTVSNVDSLHFGLLFSRMVDDQIYAQPLIVNHLFIQGSFQDVLFIATVNNSVYCFNAEDSIHIDPLWHVNLTIPGARVIKNSDITGASACPSGYHDFSENMGIVGTPVIDTITSAMYVVSRDFTPINEKFHQYLHALDIRTGKEKPGSPVNINAVYSGNGDANEYGTIVFDALKENQRAALMLYKGVVYICWASHCDWKPYHGWMIGYDASTLQKKYTYNVTPDGGEGGIWMSGNGPCVDEEGFVYITTGNGTVGYNNDPNNPRNRGESLLKLFLSSDSIKIIDYFTPNNYVSLEKDDLDYGVDGPLLIPNSSLSLSGSKEGKIYLLNNNRMGKYTKDNSSVLQVLSAVRRFNYPEGLIHGTPVYYHYTSKSETECIYVWAAADTLTQFFFDRTIMRFDTTKIIKGNISLKTSMPGGMLSVSSNGSLEGTGILWASYPTPGDTTENHLGILDAYDARDIKKLLWSSKRLYKNKVGIFAKFNSPVIANGKVYLATFSNQVNVYGLYNP